MKEQPRINIQYSIGMEELPTEVGRVYKKALNQYRNLELPEISKNEILTSPVVKMLDEARQNLAKVDVMLGDVQSIIGAYVEYELSLNADNTKTPQDTATHEDAD